MNILKKIVLSKILDNGEPFTIDDIAYFELAYKKNIKKLIKNLERENYIKMVYYNESEHVCTSKNDEEAVIAYVPKLNLDIKSIL